MSLGRVTDEPTGKKSYRKPELTEFGSVAHLTRGNNGSNPDMGQDSVTKLGKGSDQGVG